MSVRPRLPQLRAGMAGRVYGPDGVPRGAGVGSDEDDPYLRLSPAELRQLDCVEYRADGDRIAALAGSFSDDQKAALIARAGECGSNNPLIPGLIEAPLDAFGGTALGGVLSGVADSITSGAASVLTVIVDVLGNLVLGVGGAALVVLGVARMFGVSPGSATSAAARRGA